MKKILFLIAGLLYFSSLSFAQTSRTGTIVEAPTAQRPTACTAGDVFIPTDTLNFYQCYPANTWNAVGGGGGGTPGGSDTQVQYDNGGTFAGDAAFTFINSTSPKYIGIGLNDSLGPVAVDIPPTVQTHFVAGVGGAPTAAFGMSAITAILNMTGASSCEASDCASGIFVDSEAATASSGAQAELDGIAVDTIANFTTGSTSVVALSLSAFAAPVSGTPTIPHMYGIDSSTGYGSGSPVTTGLYEYEAEAPFHGSGSPTVTNIAGLHIEGQDPSNAFGATLTAAISIEDQGTGKYGIYEASTTAKNVLYNLELGGTSGPVVTAFQGTDTNALTSGTFSGTNASVCADANSGASTSCSAYIFSAPLDLNEQAAPSGISGKDVVWGDSTAHWLKFNPNNAGAFTVAGITGAITGGHCAQFVNATTIQDNGSACGSGGTGTVTTFSSGNLSPLFTTSVANASTTPALSFSLSNAAQHTFFMNNTGGSAAPGFQTAGEADLPAATVFTDANTIFGAHTFNFTGTTLTELRVSAGLTTSTNGDIGYDTTNKNWHVWQNAADKLVGVWTAAPTNGNCVKATVTANVVNLTDFGAGCGGTPPTLQTNSVNNTTQTTLNFTNTSGASGIAFTNPSGGVESATLGSVTGGGNAVLQCTQTGGSNGQYYGISGGICQNVTPAVVPNIQSGTTYTVLQSDLGAPIFFSNSGAIAVTLNSPASYTTNFYFCAMSETGAGTVTITASGNINGGGTLAISAKNHACVYNNGSTWVALTATGF